MRKEFVVPLPRSERRFYSLEEKSFIVERYNAGKSAAEISRMLLVEKGISISVNQVAGQIRNLRQQGWNIPFRSVEVKKSATYSRMMTKRTILRGKAKADALIEAQGDPLPPVALAQPAEEAPADAPIYGEVSLRQCRWFYRDQEGINGRVCGAKVKIGTAYCNKHLQLVYTKHHRSVNHGKNNSISSRKIKVSGLYFRG